MCPVIENSIIYTYKTKSKVYYLRKFEMPRLSMFLVIV